VSIWITMLIAGALTYGIRLSFILFSGERDFSPHVQRALRFVAPAVLAAILFPELFLNGSSVNLSPGNTRLIAGLLAALVAWRTASAALTILAGMGVLLVLQVFT
jgi:branched-subunit amino acid transport protein